MLLQTLKYLHPCRQWRGCGAGDVQCTYTIYRVKKMALWEQILMGMGGLLLFFFFWPGAKAALARSKEAENPDWKGALIPIGIVVLFVIVLISLARS